MTIRVLAFVIGLCVLAATAHVTIVAAGGYGSPHAVLTLAIAAGTGIGALVIGITWSQRRRTLAVALALALVCGELFGLAMTAERLVAQREATQAPARQAASERTALKAEIAAHTTRLGGLTSTPRLEAALARERRAGETVSAKAAEKGCAQNCRVLLEAEVQAAAVEVTAARGELAQQRRTVETAIEALRTRLAQLPAPQSGTPLADRLGLPAWLLDLIVAALGSLGANGLAATLVAFAAHRPALVRRTEPAPFIDARSATISAVDATPLPPPAELPSAVEPVAAVLAPRPRKQRTTPRATVGQSLEPAETASTIVASAGRAPITNITQHAARFGLERLAPAPEGRASLKAIHAAYRAWCAEVGSEELPAPRIAEALAKLFSGVGIVIELADGEPVARGIALKTQQALAA